MLFFFYQFGENVTLQKLIKSIHKIFSMQIRKVFIGIKHSILNNFLLNGT
ncbi:hypothetical protein P278_14420 [Zhouia amylolytica AD3]|uniref:Uncharacterized protein n=1 Tax=Zhouia amylolytica AD3 TaxID=1286632 RepID=W2UNH5_9FLAO|nr:hypothetical protein P278_14420 [Zhouia amylolytica AD3]